MYTHGGSDTRLYHIWHGMRSRCNTPTVFGYEYYGGRGIKVCSEWENSFEIFREWALSHGYDDTLTIDRKDTNGDYTPDNCQWITQTEQTQNRRSRCTTVMYTYKGEIKTAFEWAAIIGVSVSNIRNRFKSTGTPYSKKELALMNSGNNP